MREPLFTPRNDWLLINGDKSDPAIQDRAALQRAIGLAIEGAFSYGIDLPVGAVALEGGAIIGRGFANDGRFGLSHLHAEQAAIYDTDFDTMGGKPETLVVTLEPCGDCQQMLSKIPTLEKVVFGISRAEIAGIGLVNPKDEDIFESVKRRGYNYDVEMVEDDELHSAGRTLLNNVTRNIKTGKVEIDRDGLREGLVALNAN